ncbi:MAG TPA: fatty acid desaturase, partial [Rhodoferax sp.]|nr:fatty acid desaturase [Rhodoferax sp.]
MAQIFRYPDGVWPNVAALAFTLLGYGAGVALLGSASWALNALGLALVAQTLVWSAYFIHEFAHNAIFKSAAANERWGNLMSWV